MSDSFKLQASPKLGNTLVNIQGDNPDEFAAHLGWVENNAAKIVASISALEAAYAGLSAVAPLAPHVASTQVQQEQGGWQNQQAAPPQFAQQQAAAQGGDKRPNDFVDKTGNNPPAGPRPTCAHGDRNWKSFTSKGGKFLEMWTCVNDTQGSTAPKCDVVWPPRGRR